MPKEHETISVNGLVFHNLLIYIYVYIYIYIYIYVTKKGISNQLQTSDKIIGIQAKTHISIRKGKKQRIPKLFSNKTYLINIQH